MAALASFVRRHPWIFFVGMSVANFASSAAYALAYSGWLVKIDGGVGLAAFEPMFIFPVILLDTIFVMLLIGYRAYGMSSLLVTAFALFFINVLAIRDFCHYVIALNFHDFFFRILGATVPPFFLVSAFFVYVLVIGAEKDALGPDLLDS